MLLSATYAGHVLKFVTVEKIVEGNKISCFSINVILNIFPIINVYPKTATTKFDCSLNT